MTYLLIITLAPSPTPSQLPHTLFDIISLGADAPSCPGYMRDSALIVHITIIHNTISGIMSSYFLMNWLHGKMQCNARTIEVIRVSKTPTIRHIWYIVIFKNTAYILPASYVITWWSYHYIQFYRVLNNEILSCRCWRYGDRPANSEAERSLGRRFRWLAVHVGIHMGRATSWSVDAYHCRWSKTVF